MHYHYTGYILLGPTDAPDTIVIHSDAPTFVRLEGTVLAYHCGGSNMGLSDPRPCPEGFEFDYVGNVDCRVDWEYAV